MAFSEEWYETELKSSELETLHRPPTVEYSFYTAVKTGDMETVVANCKEDAFIHLEGTGVLSRNTLTNIKYHFESLPPCLHATALTAVWSRNRPIV